MKIDNKILKAELIDWQIIKDLQPNNLKNPTNQKALRESLKKHGFSKAFDVWQDETGIYFVDGHTRADMLRELVADGFEIPDKLMCNFLDVKTRKEAIQKLLEVHNQKQNQINSEVGMDWVVEEGVEDVAWDWLNVSAEVEPEQLEAEEDDFEAPDTNQIKTDIVKGDIYEFRKGGKTLHRLMCGDSTSVDEVGKLMNGEKADMVFTSPPYNQGGGGMKYDYNGDVKKLYQENTDKKTELEYFDFCISILNVINLILKEDSAIFWNVAYNANARADYGKIVFSDLNPFNIYETIIWDKGSAFPTASKGILSRTCEFVFLMSKQKYYTNQGENEPIFNVWRISSNGAQNETHKACFPVGLPREGIKLCSKEKGIIFEPFTGSGSTMVASHQLKRKCYGMELDERYCQVIIDRMKKLDSELEVIKVN